MPLSWLLLPAFNFKDKTFSVTYKFFRPSRGPQTPPHQPGYLDPRPRASRQFLISLSGIFLQAAGCPSNRPQAAHRIAGRWSGFRGTWPCRQRQHLHTKYSSLMVGKQSPENPCFPSAPCLILDYTDIIIHVLECAMHFSASPVRINNLESSTTPVLIIFF
jgi:hypothetical protein